MHSTTSPAPADAPTDVSRLLGLPTVYGFRIFDYWRRTNRPDPADYELRD